MKSLDVNKYLLPLIIIISLSLLHYLGEKDKEFIIINRPIPLEILYEKNNRKEFKKSREEYIDLIHKSAPDINWKNMDRNFRKDRSYKRTQERAEYIDNNGYWGERVKDIFLNRELEGTWQERGSNNLSGRVHTVDVDFNNNLIYLASSGGNIWKGTLDGNNWESLNDYMQINDIKLVRLIETANIRRLLIGSADGFFYTDDEGVIINQSEGLDSPLDWGEFYRFIIKGDSDNSVIYALVKEWDTFNRISI